MTADLDTLLTALYVLIDDHVIASGQQRQAERGSEAGDTPPY